MVKTNKMRLRSWITYGLYAISIFTTFLLITSISYYWYRYVSILRIAKIQIHTIAEERSNDIEFFFENYIHLLHTIAKKDSTSDALLNPLQRTPFIETLSNYEELLNYKDIWLINNDGIITFSLYDKALVNTSLTQGPLKQSTITQSFQRCRMSLTTDISDFSVNSHFQEPILVISTPVFHNNVTVGVLMMRVNQAQIYNVIHNYQNLKTSGDIMVAKGIEDGVLLIAPTRHIPNSAFTLKEMVDTQTPLYRATRGENSLGTYYNKSGMQYLAAWRYIASTGWGLLVSIKVDEVLEPLNTFYEYLIWLLLFWILVLYILFMHMRAIGKILPIREFLRLIYRSSSLKIVLYILWGFCVILLLLNIYRYYTLPKQVIMQTKHELNQLLEKTEQDISAYLQRIAQVGNALATDLTTGRLKKEDLLVRMRRDLEENPTVFGIIIAYEPYQYNQKELFAPFMIHHQKEYTTYQLESYYHYTNPDPSHEYNSKWYRSALKKGALWINPFFEKITQQRLGFYSVPFYAASAQTKNPVGVVSIAYSLHHLNAIVNSLSIGQTGYAFVLSDKGHFIAHPLESYIAQKKTIFEVAQQTANDILQKMGKYGSIHKPFRGNYYDSKSSQVFHAQLKPIQLTTWSLGALFVEQEVAISSKVLFRYQLCILLLLVLVLILTSGLAVNIHLRTQSVLKQFSLLVTILLIIAQISIWYILAYSNPEESKKEIKIVDTTGLDKFFDNATYQAQSKNEQTPVAIPTGIFVNNIRLDNANRIFFQAYVWQKYNKETPDTVIGNLQFPGASNVEKEKIYDQKTDTAHVVGWKVSAALTQKTNLTFFPFDDIKIKIPLASSEMIHNIILLPDLTDYQHINPSLIPGASTELQVPGFSIVQSFFAFEKIKPHTNFGLKEYSAISDRFQLSYLLILSRNLINVFIVYFIPLLILLFSLYTIFLFVNKKNVLSIVTSYTGLLFALVVLHQTLRNNYPAERILYIEYFFFFVYSSILLMVLHSLFLKMYGNHRFFEHLTIALRIFFWPLQLLGWFITTIIIFYE